MRLECHYRWIGSHNLIIYWIVSGWSGEAQDEVDVLVLCPLIAGRLFGFHNWFNRLIQARLLGHRVWWQFDVVMASPLAWQEGAVRRPGLFSGWRDSAQEEFDHSDRWRELEEGLWCCTFLAKQDGLFELSEHTCSPVSQQRIVGWFKKRKSNYNDIWSWNGCTARARSEIN